MTPAAPGASRHSASPPRPPTACHLPFDALVTTPALGARILHLTSARRDEGWAGWVLSDGQRWWWCLAPGALAPPGDLALLPRDPRVRYRTAAHTAWPRLPHPSAARRAGAAHIVRGPDHTNRAYAHPLALTLAAGAVTQPAPAIHRPPERTKANPMATNLSDYTPSPGSFLRVSLGLDLGLPTVQRLRAAGLDPGPVLMCVRHAVVHLLLPPGRAEEWRRREHVAAAEDTVTCPGQRQPCPDGMWSITGNHNARTHPGALDAVLSGDHIPPRLEQAASGAQSPPRYAPGL